MHVTSKINAEVEHIIKLKYIDGCCHENFIERESKLIQNVKNNFEKSAGVLEQLLNLSKCNVLN